MPTYGLYVRDASRTRVGEVDDFSALEVVLRFNAVGSWQLTSPTQSVAAQLLDFGGGFILMRDGVTLLSGPVRRLERTWSQDGDVTVASGPDDLTLLADRYASPDPTLSGPDGANHYNTQTNDVRSGAAESVIKAYVAYNVGASAVAARQVPGLVNATDAGRGASVTGRARFDNLLALCQTLAQAGGVGMTLLQQVAVGGFPLQFECYVPTDRSATARFTAQRGTLAAFTLTQAAAEANYIVAAGGGEGTARIFREAGDSTSIATYGRIEEFLDQRQTTVTAELDQAISDELASKAQRTELQLTPIESPALAFVTDYGLGDTVSVVVDETPLVDIIRTLTITLTKDKGETITPFVGTPALADQYVPTLFRKLAEAHSRISNLEGIAISQFSWPFDAGSGANITEGQWWKMAQMWAPDGVLSTVANGTGATGGELLVFGDNTGMQIKVQVGQAWIKGEYYELDAQLTLGPLTPADASNPRIDRVVVRIDWTTNTGALVVLGGTPGVTPAVPSLAATPGTAFDLPLAQVLVRAGTTTILSTDVTDERVYTDLQCRMPAGVMMDYAGSVAPLGWLLCYGQTLSRTQYPRLFTAIGTAYGAPSGSTFSLPDCRGRVMVALDNLGGSAASRLASASSLNGSGGTATNTLTPTELPTHHHTGSSLIATAVGASADHVHQVDPPATTSDTESAIHHHAVDPPSTNTGTESATHLHAGAAQTGLSTANTTNSHSHGPGSLAGTTGNPDVAHHHTSGVSGANFVPSTGPVSAAQPGSDPTGDDTPAHKHAFSVTAGATASDGATHLHVFDVPSANTGNESATHLHAVDIASFSSGDESATHTHTTDILAFNSGGMSANHVHTITMSGNTGDTGTGAAFDNTQPWLALGKIIKY